MNYTNFKKIIDDLKLIANKHKQINSFGIGSIENLIYLTQEKEGLENEQNEAPIYPLMYVIPEPHTVNENFLQYSYTILIMDIMNVKNYDTQVDLWSETFQMAQDVIAQYKYSVFSNQGDYESLYDLELPITCSPFSEAYDDFLVGWSFSLPIIVDSPLNRCIAPYKNF
jgi:hypothetical protein